MRTRQDTITLGKAIATLLIVLVKYTIYGVLVWALIHWTARTTTTMVVEAMKTMKTECTHEAHQDTSPTPLEDWK